MNKEKHLQLKIGDDAVLNFNYIVDSNNGEAVTEVIFGYYGREKVQQIIAIQGENLTLNPKLNVTWKSKINIIADLTSVAELNLTKVTEKSLFDITFYCDIRYYRPKESRSKSLDIKLEIVCKYATHDFCLSTPSQVLVK